MTSAAPHWIIPLSVARLGTTRVVKLSRMISGELRHLLPLPLSSSSSAEAAKEAKRSSADPGSGQRSAKVQKSAKRPGSPGAVKKTNFAVPKELIGKMYWSVRL